MKKESKDIIRNSIISVAEKLIKNPYYFVNEEDIRCELYHYLSQSYKQDIILTYNTEKMVSNSCHADGCILDKNGKKHYVDLQVYYSRRTIPIKLNKEKGRLYFFGNIDQVEKNANRIRRRILVEIKFSRLVKSSSAKIYRKILNDYSKRKDLDFEKCYLFYVERWSNIDNITISKIRGLTAKDKRYDIIYVGYPKDRVRCYAIYFKNGKLKKILYDDIV